LRWRIVAAAFVASVLALGIRHCNVSFFCDYFQPANAWPRAEVALGFPLAALLASRRGPLPCTAISLAGTGVPELAILPKHQPWPPKS
jgi:hypothetical protein